MTMFARTNIAVVGLAILLIAGWAAAQTPSRTPAKPSDAHVRGSAAYAELVLRETELRAEAESLLEEYTEDFPKVREARYAVTLVQREKARLMTVPEKDAGRLTLSLGKILVRKVEAEMELRHLQQTLADGHPDVKRAMKKVEVFENAVKELLG